MTPPTLYQVYTAGWLDVRHAPPDAPDWLELGYLALTAQGKLTGYTVTLKTYRGIVDFWDTPPGSSGHKKPACPGQAWNQLR